jgi:hypothetical protein
MQPLFLIKDKDSNNMLRAEKSRVSKENNIHLGLPEAT